MQENLVVRADPGAVERGSDVRRIEAADVGCTIFDIGVSVFHEDAERLMSLRFLNW